MVSATDLLQDGYDRISESVSSLLSGLSAGQAAARLDGTSNSIAWLLWHTSRMMDAQVAPIAGRDDVVGAYYDRLGVDLPMTDTGFGHGAAEVARVGSVDLVTLGEYHAAVQAMVSDLLASEPDLDAIVDHRWDPPVTMAARLVSIVDDAARHVGQAEFVHGVLRRRG